MGIYNAPNLIQEVYFGKTNGINELQKQFSKFRGKFINSTFKFSTKINIDPDLLKFNRMIENEFGFKTFSLYIINNIYYNAYTIPIGLTPGKSMTASETGFKFKGNRYTTMVCMSTGILLDKKFTDEELFAILLHEIGHNFSQNIDKHTSIFFTIQYVVSLIHTIEQILLMVLVPFAFAEKLIESIFTLPALNRIFISFGEKYRKKQKNATRVFDFLSGAINAIITVFEELNIGKSFYILLFSSISEIKLIEDYLLNKIKNITPMAILNTILGYNGERISDNFATVYGYGSELSTALQKMEYSNDGSIVKTAAEKVPVINNMYKLMILPMEIIATGFDVHPNTPARVNQQLIYLEKELQKTDLDPIVKEDIINDIKKLKQGLKNNMFSLRQKKVKNKIKDPYLIPKVYSTIMYKIAGGDVRELLYTIDNHQQFEDAYEKYKK